MSNKRDFVIANGYLDRYTGNETDIIIPDTVSKIGYGVFRNQHNLLSVVIHDNVRIIGNSAFRDCENLRFVKMSDGITDVSYYAFENCKSLTQIDFKTFALGADNNAFSGCDNLTDIVFPENDSDFVGIFRAFEFRIFRSKQSIIMLAALLEKKLDFVKSDASLGRKMKANKAKLINFAVKAEKPAIVENLFSLYPKKIKLDELNDYIADAKDSIGVTAFLLQYKAEHYSADEQERHENAKFEKELGLKKFTLEDWRRKFVLSFKHDSQTVTIKGYKGRENQIIIPEEINKYKVDCILSLSSPHIEFIQIPDNITIISDSCFDGCTGLADKNGFVVFRNKLYNYFGTQTDVTIPEGVTEIGNYAFQGCSGIKSITVPDSATKISGQAFIDCISLETINFTKSNT